MDAAATAIRPDFQIKSVQHHGYCSSIYVADLSMRMPQQSDLQARKVLVDDTRSFNFNCLSLDPLCVSFNADIRYVAGECGVESEELAEGSAVAMPFVRFQCPGGGSCLEDRISTGESPD